MEKPEWLEVRGSLSFMYEGFPPVGDPNVQVELLKIIFSSRANGLQSSAALAYAKWVRILLPLGIIFFGVFIIGVISSAP